jgi:hypothetical protein
MGYAEKCIYGHMQTRVYYESMRMEIRTAWQLLVEVAHIEF